MHRHFISRKQVRRSGLHRSWALWASGVSGERILSLESLEERQLLTLAGNMLFPADNPWNQVITAAPVAANSQTLISSIGATRGLHPDFGTIYEGAYIGIPYVIVSASQPKVPVMVDAYPDESDLMDVPIPAGAPIEGDPLPSSENNGDRHLIVYDQDNNVAYELYNVHRPTETADGKWHADSLAFWDMNQNWFRTPGDTSADAAGLPILPGLVRPDEVLDQGVINHALRFTVPRSRNQYVFPASHHAGSNNASYPRMGERFRLRADFDISGFSPNNQVILQALKTYGMIVADNGSGWYISGEPSSRWDDEELSELTTVLGSDFEAVDLKPIVAGLSTGSGPSSGGTSVTVTGTNFSGAAGQLKVYFGTTLATSVTVLSDSTVVATSPAHAAGTVQVTVVTPYGTSATTSNTQFTFSTSTAVQVAGRYIFYNQSAWDGNNAAITGASDDAAIAPDKSAYLLGTGIAGISSITSYSRGINGIMVDLTAGANHGAITASDFDFKVGQSSDPATWINAPAPASLSVRLGAGADGSDRIVITWANNVIQNAWLQVVVKGDDALGGNNTRTGLAASDLFFFGNRIGDTFANSPATLVTTNASDEIAVRNAVSTNRPITNAYDFNKDMLVNVADQILARANVGVLTREIQAMAAQSQVSFPPGTSRDGVAVASALAIRAGRGKQISGILAAGDLQETEVHPWVPPSPQPFETASLQARDRFFARFHASSGERDRHSGLHDELDPNPTGEDLDGASIPGEPYWPWRIAT